MAYLDTLTRSTGAGPAGVSALAFPLWETTVPQYPHPNPYDLAKNGYARNELVYACINKWMKAIAEAPLHVYDNREKTPSELPDHPLRKLLRKPNPYMSEKAFWRAVQMWLKIAGFSPWEIESNRLGEPIALWPMSPHWCAFRRGPGKPIAWVEYKPWGVDLSPVPIERVLLFQYTDPVAPFVKALSPSAVAGRVSAVDNNATDFMKLFWEHGAVVNGLLTTEQPLQDAEAMLIRKMWSEQHGGFRNWADPAVLGQGVKYQQTQMDFRQMTFGDLDARDETRICQAFAMQPILVSAKVGLDRSTFSNYGEARKAQYEEEYMPEWDFLEAEVENQLLPKFIEDPVERETFLLDFDISQVHALQEDRTGKWTRATTAFEKNIVTRDEAREEMDLDPIDNAPVFSSDTKPAPPMLAPAPPSDLPGAETETPAGATSPAATPDPSAALEAARAAERKQFQAFVLKRVREGQPERIADFKFKFLARAEQKRLIEEAQDREGSDAPFEVPPRAAKASAYGSKAHRAAMAKFDERTAPLEAKVQKVVTQLLKKQSAALAGKFKSRKDAAKAGPPDLGRPDEWAQEFEDALEPVLREILETAAKHALADAALDVVFDVVNPRVKEFIAGRVQRFAAKVNATTWEKLKVALQEGIDAGESISSLADRITGVMGDRIVSSAETIARTETMPAYHWATLEAWKGSGVVTGKQYLAALDSRTRETHAEAHGQIVGIDEPFVVGGYETQYPGETGVPEEDINCRCSMIAVME